MTNELTVIQKIEKKLKADSFRDKGVFPLASNHRKELRELRANFVGDVTTRLSILKDEKLEEFRKKNSKEIKKEILTLNDKCSTLNDNWNDCIDKIRVVLDERKTFEENILIEGIDFECDYNDLSKLKITETKRLAYVNDKRFDVISKDMFDTKYGYAFNEVNKLLQDIKTKYEEAINFGDLGIVKELYYTLKDSDTLFKKIESLKI